MAVCNRDLDISEADRVFAGIVSTSVGASAASSFFVSQMPYPGTLKALSVAALSVSGAPVVSLDLKRFTSAGVTTVASLGSGLTLIAHGTSQAYQLMTLATSGSTLLMLQAGDVLVLNQNFSGGNVGAAQCVVTAVVQAVQDIKSFFGTT